MKSSCADINNCVTLGHIVLLRLAVIVWLIVPKLFD